MKVKRLNIQEKNHSFDVSLLFVTIFLCIFGLIMVYSASYYTAATRGLPGDYYFRRQLRSNLLGIALMLAAAFVPYHLHRISAPVLYAVALILMVLTNFTSLGYTAGGRTRWITLFGIRFQTAEVVKMAVILLLAMLVLRYARRLRGWKLWLLLLGVALVPAILVASNDLSSAVIIAALPLVIIILLNNNKRLSWFLIIAGILILALGIYIKTMDMDRLQQLGAWITEHTPLHEYQMRRIYMWNDPAFDAQGDGYQILQGLYAIGSGGLFGKGLGASTQKLGFVPEASNDMIFSILCEELGLFGALSLILLYLFLLYRMLIIANQADDVFGSLITVGVMSQIALQVIFHIGVAFNIIPNTGISLPFISYGGTSSLFLMAEVGIVLNVGRGNSLRRKA